MHILVVTNTKNTTITESIQKSKNIFYKIWTNLLIYIYTLTDIVTFIYDVANPNLG